MHKLTLILFSLSPVFAQSSGWWMKEPIRWVQTNLRETDSASSPERLVEEAAKLGANVMHVNMGGIVATYPARTPFHYASAYLPPGKDFFGDVVRLAHARKIRVVGRFDFSKTRKEVFDAHPEWFFRMASGEPVVYNGLYSTCINSGWYREHALAILSEALERYEVDGLFFNMFGNQSRDYSGNFVGHCHCDACKTRFRAMFGRDLPAKPDADYERFMFVSSREVAAEFGKLIHARRPAAGYFNYIDEHTDGIMSESNTAVSRALPLWPYTSSDNVNRARNSQPEKMSVNLCMQFVDYPWRFVTVPPHEIELRLWQNIAHGGALAFSINGTFDQNNPFAVEAARPVFSWAAANERYLVRQESMARVLLVSTRDQQNYRGLFRILTEAHIPFAVSSNFNILGKRKFDLVIVPGAAPELAGVKVLAVSAQPPQWKGIPAVKTEPDVQGYIRVRNNKNFPSLRQDLLLMLDGPFTAMPPAAGGAPLTLVPPSMYGPPEKIHLDLKDTETPALVWFEGDRKAWLPWETGALYYRHSLPAHKDLITGLIDTLLGGAKQLKTNAHPLVEMSLMKQDGRTLLHLINLTGHSQTGYFPALLTGPVEIDLEGSYGTARALRAAKALPVQSGNGRTKLTLPRLGQYELIVLEGAARPRVTQ